MGRPLCPQRETLPSSLSAAAHLTSVQCNTRFHSGHTVNLSLLIEYFDFFFNVNLLDYII